MKIESYEIGMDSARTYSSTSTRKLTFGYMRGELGSLDNGNFQGAYGALGDSEDEQEAATNSITSEDAWNRFTGSSISAADNIKSINDNSLVRDIHSFRQQLILYLWSTLFGKEAAQDMSKKLGINDMNQMNNNAPGQGSFAVITVYGAEECYMSENEATSFSSAGKVRLADGREIEFNVEANMTRKFEAYYRQEGIGIQKMIDPLVLNFSGDVAGLSDQKFTFDLDADGEEEEISMLTNGNGFLALDKNGDGIINDGNELFGTKSGDGFSDLAMYDEDHNGWIDENDQIFDKLKIWVKDETGHDELLSLKEKNVGAIYLGNVSTDFTLQGSSGAANGAIRRTGIFLYEDGLAGTLSHLDIAN